MNPSVKASEVSPGRVVRCARHIEEEQPGEMGRAHDERTLEARERAVHLELRFEHLLAQLEGEKPAVCDRPLQALTRVGQKESKAHFNERRDPLGACRGACSTLDDQP